MPHPVIVSAVRTPTGRFLGALKGLTATELALLNSIFFWIYAVTAFLAGRLGDSARRFARAIVPDGH